MSGVFEMLGTVAMVIDDPGEVSIAERHALAHVLDGLRNRNEAVLASDGRRERALGRHKLRTGRADAA